jgi:hypothetical protein
MKFKESQISIVCTYLMIILPLVFMTNEGVCQNQSKDMSHLNCDSTFVAISEIEFKDQPDSVAEFPGGKNEFYKYLSSLEMKEKVSNDHGIYFVLLIIEANGEISNECILRPRNPYPMGDAIISKVKEMPKWNPAMKNGTNVRSIYIFPIRFCVGR